MEKGYIILPYQIEIGEPLLLADKDWKPTKMIKSRFGTKMIDGKFYEEVKNKEITEKHEHENL